MKTPLRFHPRRISVVLCLLAMCLGLYAQGTVHIIIMHTNNIHGRIQPDSGIGGSARLATIVRRIQPDLMLDGGDMFTGSLISDKFEGEPVIDIMNAIGYDAAALGADEFDYGVEALRARARQANFPFLSANTLSLDEVHEAAIFNAQGVKIAVIGATTPKQYKDVEIIDVVRAIEDALPKVRDRSDFIVLLAHLTPEEELQVARAFPELRLIIGGHEHRELQPSLTIGNTTIVRSGAYGKYVGRVDLNFNFREGSPEIQTALIPVRDVEPDPEIVRLLTPYERRVEAELR